MKNLPLKQNIEKKSMKNEKVIWNLDKEGGWNHYHSLTNTNMKLDKVTFHPIEDNDKTYDKFTKEVKKCKFKSFGKVSSPSKIMLS